MSEPRMMMTPKPNRPPPVMPPSSVWVKPYSLPQRPRMPARTEKPTPEAKMAKKPAQSSRLAFGVVPLVMVPVRGAGGCGKSSAVQAERLSDRRGCVNTPAPAILTCTGPGRPSDPVQRGTVPMSDAGVLKTDFPPVPFTQFRIWYEQAVAACLPQPEAMTLATADAEGKPSARMVLLRGVDERGFVFFTNYDSRKARELEANPRAALVFYWFELHRQVRVEGRAERVPAAESDAYFAGRPRGSQLGAWASPQSQVIGDRQELERRLEEVAAAYPHGRVPRPPFWGGFRVLPDLIEFWQQRPNRLHDRLCYVRRGAGGWQLQRLAP